MVVNFVKIFFPTELELKMEHNGSCATFLDLDISIDKGKFTCKMFHKRDTLTFMFSTFMPSSNIPFIIFYSSTMSEFVTIARSTLLLKGILPGAKNL